MPEYSVYEHELGLDAYAARDKEELAEILACLLGDPDAAAYEAENSYKKVAPRTVLTVMRDGCLQTRKAHTWAAIVVYRFPEPNLKRVLYSHEFEVYSKFGYEIKGGVADATKV